jgi:RNA polymerase sigma-70 factor (ECF subfamily)
MRGDRVGAVEDVALVREVAQGSQDALATLYDRHAEAVYVAACRLTNDRQVAEEVVQETFLALWNRAELFDPNAGSLAAWLHTIARNRTVDRLRAIGRRPRLIAVSSIGQEDEHDSSTLERIASTGAVVGGADVDPGPEAALDALEIRQTIRGALDDMPEVERTVILLAYRDNLTQAEIATRLGWPLGTVKTRTRRALLRLREALGASLGPDAGLTMVPVTVTDEVH